MDKGGRERRESGRAAVQLPIEYERLNALLSDYTHNISRGGTFIRTNQPLAAETVLSFTIQAPQLGEPILLRGVVRWVVELDQARPERPAGMGIGFVFDSTEHKAAIEGRLDRRELHRPGRRGFWGSVCLLTGRVPDEDLAWSIRRLFATAVGLDEAEPQALFDRLESLIASTPRTTTRRFFNQLFSGRDDFGSIGEILRAVDRVEQILANPFYQSLSSSCVPWRSSLHWLCTG